MRLRLIRGWDLANWALLPTIVVGGWERGAWIYVYWLRGRLGVSLR